MKRRDHSRDEGVKVLEGQLVEANARLTKANGRLVEAEETLRAIREGEVDALVVAGLNGDQIFTLQGAETPYRFLVEEMNEGALLISLDGTILYANARFAALVSLGLEQVIGSTYQRFFAASEQPGLEALASAARGKAGVKGEFCLQTGERLRPVEVSLAWMHRDAVEGFAAVVTDLMERKAAEEALRASNARLQEMVEELERFSYSISHDMRAPLRAMMAFAAELEESCADRLQAENLDLLGRIRTAAIRLDALIQGSLEYARAVKQELALQTVALDGLVGGMVKANPNLRSENADITVEGRLPVVQGNKAALTQVFSNLLGNAVKFVAPGVRPRVRLWAEQQEDRARVWVEDNGIGISAEFQPRMFVMFQRESKDYEGTGVGLAVVRHVVERMGGHVGVESKPGWGSRFWVELKAAESKE